MPDAHLRPGNAALSTMALASRIALVTGAASGLGRATALRFAKAGARVVLGDLPSDSLQAAAEAIGREAAKPADVVACGADVVSADDVRARHAETLTCTACRALTVAWSIRHE